MDRAVASVSINKENLEYLRVTLPAPGASDFAKTWHCRKQQERLVCGPLWPDECMNYSVVAVACRATRAGCMSGEGGVCGCC